jgi:hypothetical protein
VAIALVLLLSAVTFVSLKGSRVLMYVGFAAFACMLTVPALFPTLPMLFVATPLIGVTSMIFIVATQNLVYMPLYSRGIGLPASEIGLIVGALGAVLGVAPVFWTCAVLMGGGAALNRRGDSRKG